MPGPAHNAKIAGEPPVMFPRHPFAVIERIALATPNPCEGSLGHLREMEMEEIIQDYNRAVKAGDRNEAQACVYDAVATARRWTLNPRSV
jgi:hypothetical protein